MKFFHSVMLCLIMASIIGSMWNHGYEVAIGLATGATAMYLGLIFIKHTD